MADHPTQLTSDASGLPAFDAMLQEWIQATEALQATHETLQAEVERLRVELADKNRELERKQRLASLGELAAGVAHEVRNPLGAIRLYSEILKRDLGPHPALELIDKIQAGVTAIDGVVQDTLALAPRAVAGLPCYLRDLLQGAQDLCCSNLVQQDVTLDVTPFGEHLAVGGDASALQRVIVNLINNAAEASPAGAVVSLQVEELPQQRVAVRIADRGCGFATDVLEKIFDPFFTTKTTGTGLGLTIAHRLVEAHGGCLRAANRTGGGALMEIVLPTITPDNESCRNTSAA